MAPDVIAVATVVFRAPGAGPEPEPTATFNPADRTASVTLSPDNLTATFTAAGNAFVRTVTSRDSGLFYVEYRLMVGGGASTGAGFARSAATEPNATDTINVAAYYIGSGNIWVNGANPGALGVAQVNDVVGCAINLNTRLVWFRRNAGLWNNNASANPATGAFGASLSALALPLFGWVSGTGAGPRWVANFGGSEYAYPKPEGYGPFKGA